MKYFLCCLGKQIASLVIARWARVPNEASLGTLWDRLLPLHVHSFVCVCASAILHFCMRLPYLSAGHQTMELGQPLIEKRPPLKELQLSPPLTAPSVGKRGRGEATPSRGLANGSCKRTCTNGECLCLWVLPCVFLLLFSKCGYGLFVETVWGAGPPVPRVMVIITAVISNCACKHFLWEQLPLFP